MNNQKSHWDKLHTQGHIAHYSDKPTDFGLEVLNLIDPNSKILELGCGAGNDSIVFAQAHHNVIATDFSEVAINKNRERFKDISNLSFQAVDMNNPLSFPANQFDLIYARLSLHYFAHLTTQRIFDDIHKLLKPNGLLCFMCKSTDDPIYGKGFKLEKDLFENEGHVRHFFSEKYAKSLLGTNFVIQKIENGKEKFYGDDSAYVKVIAKASK